MLAAVLSKDGSDWLQSSLNHVITVGPIVSQVPFSASLFPISFVRCEVRVPRQITETLA